MDRPGTRIVAAAKFRLSKLKDYLGKIRAVTVYIVIVVLHPRYR